MAKTILSTRARRFGVAAGSLLAAVALWSGVGNTMRAAPVLTPDPLTCLPTCEIDGRSLVVAGNDPTTLGAVQINIGLNFTATSSGFNFELFDGDRDSTNWDVPWNDGVTSPKPKAPELIMSLYGAGDAPGLLITWGPGYFAFPTSNNGWAGVSYAFHDNVRAKIAATGGYRYRLEIRPANPAVDLGWNAFKVRSNGTVALNGAQTIAFIGAMNVPGDLNTIYPDWPLLTNSPYDGTWSFKARLPNFLKEVSVWDGDMDYGDTACTYGDTDDPDTPATPPGFASGANNEGVAQVPGSACRTGIPADDALSAAFRRVPSIVSNGIAYRLVAPASLANPGGQTFLNSNPSGNREWEQFRIQLVASAADVPSGACPAGGYPADAGKGYAASDCRTTDLPGGVWEVQLDGMDLSNLNFWYFGFQVEPIPTYSIGRLVWYDDNENGVQDLCAGVPCAPELGVPGVTVTVSNTSGPVAAGVTDANGEFLFDQLPSLAPWPADDYTVVVDASNFLPGGPLEGWVSTTGGETVTGVEVGLPVCVDTNNPVGCGEPTYAEAIFGYVEHPEECVVIPIKGGTPFIGAVHSIVANPAGAPAGAITLRTTLSKLFVDNTYGADTSLVGWPSGGHDFSKLVGSDKIQLALYDANDVKQLEFKMDYISAFGGAPGGYKSLGVTGGDGGMILGSAANIWAVDTSLSKNFRDGMQLTVNSPATDAAYTPNAAYPNWIFEVYYDVTFTNAAFGAGFGYPRVTSFHASPSKTGSNTEVCVYPDEPPVAVEDGEYHTKKNINLVLAAPGVLGNDFPGGSGGPITAELVTGPSHGTLVGGLNPNGSFTYAPNLNFTDKDEFYYRVLNTSNGKYSAAVRVRLKVDK